MSGSGWYRVSRDLHNPQHDLHPHTSGDPACRAFAWLDLIAMARWEDGGGLKRGELRKGQRLLAARWHWSKVKVKRFLDELEARGRIQKHPSSHPRQPDRISICNYSAYQEPRTASEPASEPTNVTASEPTSEPTFKKNKKKEEPEEETPSGSDDPKTKGPEHWMHDIWHEELGAGGHRIQFTAKRKKKYRAMYEEHLSEAKRPRDAWRAVLQCVQQSDHHMSVRRYQFPESLLRNQERREQWVQDTLHAIRNGGGSKADQKIRRNARSMAEHLRKREAVKNGT